jgi:hypothetical protein
MPIAWTSSMVRNLSETNSMAAWEGTTIWQSPLTDGAPPKGAQCPIAYGPDEIGVLGFDEVEDRMDKRLRLAGRAGIVQCLAAITRHLGGSKQPRFAPHPMAVASGGSGEGKRRRTVSV